MPTKRRPITRRRCRICLGPLPLGGGVDCPTCARLLHLILDDPHHVTVGLPRSRSRDFCRGVLVAAALVRRLWCP